MAYVYTNDSAADKACSELPGDCSRTMPDQDMIKEYLRALRAARDATDRATREAAEKRAATLWFVMDVATYSEARWQAKEEGLDTL